MTATTTLDFGQLFGVTKENLKMTEDEAREAGMTLAEYEEMNNLRASKQRRDEDYDDEMEKCKDCGHYLNSHDHCPRCDY